ncbi:MAG: undecaprenyldiphospho-muramoylpentapeptide beta-N-acetylglucosaminyltransferase [Saprospiraceae bacterium]|nr:undecaprenyldiphospho-muramoylpentapeptide beta-N-acetylglucosaminyltransferase [Saprospiraceae bacterium]
MKLLISGGGTGGHVFPAIAIADAVKSLVPDVEILFVGALGKIEMQKVPEAGYRIIGLPIRGIQRNLSIENVKLVYRLMKCMWMAKNILKEFQPDVVVGVGGYASGPMLRMASWFTIPILIQEQNSYPGITNRLLAKAAQKICVAFEGMENYFQKNKIILTGNPVRTAFKAQHDRVEARTYFGLEKSKFTIGVFGGSLGARAMNDAIISMSLNISERNDIQWIWQTGSMYAEEMKKSSLATATNVKMLPFVDRIDIAYSACDLVVARAGALTLAELCILGTPCILVPSPNVAEDHQRKNAEAITGKGAAKMILDADLKNCLWNEIIKLLENSEEREKMSFELKQLAKPDADLNIAKAILTLVKVAV